MFHFNYVSWFAGFPPQIATFFISMLPVAELRGSLPIALGIYKLPFFEAYFWSVLGNIVPVIFILGFLDPVYNFLIKRSEFARKFFKWLFERTRRRFEGKYQKYGQLALVIFVAIPLPITGAWTGSIAAFLFGIPYKKALLLILAGVMIAGIVVGLIYGGILNGLNFFIK